MTDAEETEARAAFRAIPCTYGLPPCRTCGGAGKIGRRIYAGAYDISKCVACDGRGVIGPLAGQKPTNQE